MNTKSKAYACYSLNEESRQNSSSGGIFYLLAKFIISYEGIVYGVKMSEDCREACFSRITNLEQIIHLQGSKYFQADLQNTFNSVKTDLMNNCIVLFCGTGCQINGLKKYLKMLLKDGELENLICIDIICHGVPSPKLWDNYVKYLENEEDSKLEKVSFRSKDNGWIDFGMKYKYKKFSRFVPRNKDSFMTMFLKNYSLRPSCYDCKVKGNVFSDITIGDFWGIDNINPAMNDGKGTSVVLINSMKGNKLFFQVKHEMRFVEVDFNDAIKFNSAYYKSVEMPKERKQFYHDLNVMDFKEFISKYSLKKDSIYKRLIRKIKKVFL